MSSALGGSSLVHASPICTDLLSKGSARGQILPRAAFSCPFKLRGLQGGSERREMCKVTLQTSSSGSSNTCTASRTASSPISPPGKPPWKHLLHIGSVKTCSLSPFRGRHPADQSADRHREAEPHLSALLHNCSMMLDKLLAHRSFKGLFF